MILRRKESTEAVWKWCCESHEAALSTADSRMQQAALRGAEICGCPRTFFFFFTLGEVKISLTDELLSGMKQNARSQTASRSPPLDFKQSPVAFFFVIAGCNKRNATFLFIISQSALPFFSSPSLGLLQSTSLKTFPPPNIASFAFAEWAAHF